jgi:hypothetical protein
MLIHATSTIPHPLARVYRAYRDELPQIAAHMPDIDAITVLSRTEHPSGPRLINEWRAKARVPAAVSRFVTPEMLRWEDHAAWDDAGAFVDWALVIPAFRDGVRCAGRNRFVADGAGTRVELTGELLVQVQSVPGVPTLVLRGVLPGIERFIVELIRPNLQQVNAALARYLDARPA